MIYQCCNENRKSAIVGKAGMNGIDYLEVLDGEAPAGAPRQQILLIHCLNAFAAGQTFTADNILISGGESITGVTVVAATAAASIAAAPLPAPLIAALQPRLAGLADEAKTLVAMTNQPGDFSPYRLRLVNSAAQAVADPFEITGVLTGFDPRLADVAFSFKVECGPDFDCAPAANCPPSTQVPPPINYLAKDYGSFRTLVLDRMNQLMPSWGATSEADLGVALAELVAYVGDRLSYQQDAIATEAYLRTARRRVSLRRHALLVDYTVSDGCNARAWVQVKVGAPAGAPVFMDRAATRFYAVAPGVNVDLSVTSDNAAARAALLNGVQAFQPMHDAVLYAEHDTFSFYTWGDANCCLPTGATEATLRGSWPRLLPGDALVFQEMIGPRTGDPADADLRHRYVVRLTRVTVTDDQGNPLQDGLFTDANGQPILVTQIQWAAADALTAPVCLSSTYADESGATRTATDVSVALGNIVLADHGLSFTNEALPPVPQPFLYYAPDPSAGRCPPQAAIPVPVRYNPAAPQPNLTQAVPLAVAPLAAAGLPVANGVVGLAGPGPIALVDARGFAVLSVQATNPTGWTARLGVRVTAATTPNEIDLQVVYSAPAGAAVLPPALAPLEIFTGLSFQPAAANYVATVVNAASRLIQIPAAYVPPTAPPAGFPAAPAMLSAAAVALSDLAGAPYLIAQASDPAQWPGLFGVSTEADVEPGFFDLTVLYNPENPVGVALPVAVEAFQTLSLQTAAAAVAASALITVASFAQAPSASLSAADLTTFAAADAVASVTLSGTLAGATTTWTPVSDLLASGETDAVFVVETEFDGSAAFRFGDNVNGRFPPSGTTFTASYRVGNGTAGNLGAESLVGVAASNPLITACRNPLPASGGTDPETAEQIRRRAPQAFLTQQRAVTMEDYQTLAQRSAQVDRAAAFPRWTGSWYTASVAVEPAGGGNLTPGLASTLRQSLERYRLAGQDLELKSPGYVSLQIALTVCVDAAYFQRDVQQALQRVLSSKPLANGQTGVFHPDNFGFGQTVYLSPIYAAARAVQGVVTVTATTFQPQGVDSRQYLAAGEIKLGPLQVARLDNDPSYPAHGQLTLNMVGGK